MMAFFKSKRFSVPLKSNQLKIKIMNSFENAKSFFHNCESCNGWDACKDFVAGDGKFSAQSEPLAELTTIREYVDMWTGMGGITLKGGSYEVNASAFNEDTNVAIFFATYTGSHTGEGGPIPPTSKTTVSEYVYILTMNDEGKVVRVNKVWNSTWVMRELGWM